MMFTRHALALLEDLLKRKLEDAEEHAATPVYTPKLELWSERSRCFGEKIAATPRMQFGLQC